MRKNIGAEIVLESYGYNTGLAIDPVEKKPLYQFYPNSKVLSFGTIGCNMGCLYCQNYQTTKVRLDIKENCLNATPQQIVEVAKAFGADGVRVREEKELKAFLSKYLKPKHTFTKPVVMECLIDKDEAVFPMLKPGGSTEDIILCYNQNYT